MAAELLELCRREVAHPDVPDEPGGAELLQGGRHLLDRRPLLGEPVLGGVEPEADTGEVVHGLILEFGW